MQYVAQSSHSELFILILSAYETVRGDRTPYGVVDGLGLILRQNRQIPCNGKRAFDFVSVAGPVAAHDDFVVADFGEAFLGVDEIHQSGGVGVFVHVELYGGTLGAAV